MMPPSGSRTRTTKGQARIRAEKQGRRAELLAALFLRLKLYRIRDTRVKTPVGEIDLIAERAGTIVFVEVKHRQSAGDEAEALLAVNQGRIIRAASYYLARHPSLAGRPMRFDVIFLAPLSWPRHLKAAFHA